MKIFHVAESFGAGVYSFLVDLCNYLDEEHELTIIYSKRLETPKDFQNDFSPNIKFIELDMRFKNSLKAVSSLTNTIKIEKPDIVHLHSSKAGFVGRIATKLANYQGKLFYNPHGLAFLRQDLNKGNRKILFWSEKLLAKLGGEVIGVSQSEKEEIEKFTNNATFINNGVSVDGLNKEINQFEREISINKANKYEYTIGTIGRIEFQKNPSLFNDIAKKFPEISFVWVGDGSLKNVLNSPNIEVTGWLSRKEVIKKLSEIDLYIQTSLWEGLPISVLEAMFMKKPLVLYNTVGNKDLVVNGINGFLCKDVDGFYDKISLILNGDRETFGQSSRLLLEKEFNLNKNLMKFDLLYKEQMDKRK
ncbi:glycosyltransferase [Rossellomorea arthrocnemi]